MKRSTYEKIVGKIEEQNEWNFQACLQLLVKNFPQEKPETLRSILSQCYQKRVKKTNHLHASAKKREQVYKTFWTRSDQGEKLGILVDIARKDNFSPFLTGKYLLEDTLNRASKGGEVLKHELSRLVRQPKLLEIPALSQELLLASYADDVCGPKVEAIKHSIGVEYENKIKKELNDLCIAYQDEKHFRKQGYDKTPDFKLEVPVAVGGSVVNWIESKALFGDEESHARYLQDQLRSYWNRFGPGLVIYWFGFVDEITSVRKYSGIIVRDSFPKDLALFEPGHRLNELEDEDIAEDEKPNSCSADGCRQSQDNTSSER